MYTFKTFEERKVWVELEGSPQRKKTRQLIRNTKEQILNNNFYRRKWGLFQENSLKDKSLAIEAI